jgi:hypothetical protein
MKKEYTNIVICTLILILLMSVYAFQTREIYIDEAPEELKTPSFVSLINKQEEIFHTITLQSKYEKLVFITNGFNEELDVDIWVEESNKDIELDSILVESIGIVLSNLVATQNVGKHYNIEYFGLLNPQIIASISYKDGSEYVIYLGSLTPNREGYYVKINDDYNIYIIPRFKGDLLFHNINTLIQQEVQSINIKNFTYLYINEKDKNVIEIKHTKESPSYTAKPIMLQPIKGIEVIMDNLINNILLGIMNFTLSQLAYINPVSLAYFGLHEPELEIILRDDKDEIHLFLGYKRDDGYRYIKFYGDNKVYLANDKYFESLFGIDAISFVDRFIVMEDISDVYSIQVITQETNKYIKLNKEVLNNGDFIISPTINDEKVDARLFKLAFRELMGLTFDTTINTFSPTEKEVITIIYNFNYNTGRDSIITKYYDYNVDFYGVSIDNREINS